MARYADLIREAEDARAERDEAVRWMKEAIRLSLKETMDALITERDAALREVARLDRRLTVANERVSAYETLVEETYTKLRMGARELVNVDDLLEDPPRLVVQMRLPVD